MLDGIYRNPTEIYFGPTLIESLGPKLVKEGTSVMLIYGGESVHRCGAYKDVISALEGVGLPYVELSGIKPNPDAARVREGIAKCKDARVDLILAVGGGSVIDTAKAISLGCHYDGDIYDLFDGITLPERAIQLGVVLTLPGSGSESSPDAVISFPEYQEKRPITSPLICPRFALLNPNYTLGLNSELTMSGIWDAISHVLERYFTNEKHVECSNRLCGALIKSLMDIARLLREDPSNYNYRAEAMWACKLAHDGTMGFGRKADWATHRIAHEIAATYDTRHGETLAVIFPAWIESCYETNPIIFDRLGQELFGSQCNAASSLADNLRKFLAGIGLPNSLRQLGIRAGAQQIHRVAEKCVTRQQSGTIGNFARLGKFEIASLLGIVA